MPPQSLYKNFLDELWCDANSKLVPYSLFLKGTILVAACIFAERSILDNPRTNKSSSDDSDDSDETWPGAHPYNLYASRLEADSELEGVPFTDSLIPSLNALIDQDRHPSTDAQEIYLYFAPRQSASPSSGSFLPLCSPQEASPAGKGVARVDGKQSRMDGGE